MALWLPRFTAHTLQLHRPGVGKQQSIAGCAHFRPHQKQRGLWGITLEPSISCFASSKPRCNFLHHVLVGATCPRCGGSASESAEVLRRLPSSPWLPRDLLQRKGMLLPNPSRNLTSLDAFWVLGGRNKKTKTKTHTKKDKERKRERAHINQRFIRR